MYGVWLGSAILAGVVIGISSAYTFMRPPYIQPSSEFAAIHANEPSVQVRVRGVVRAIDVMAHTVVLEVPDPFVAGRSRTIRFSYNPALMQPHQGGKSLFYIKQTAGMLTTTL
jgi:hypothetical protein